MKVRYLLFRAVPLLVQVGSAIVSVQNSTIVLVPAPPLAKDLNLSPEKRSQLMTVNKLARKEREQLHQQLMAAEQQLRSLLRSKASIQQLRQQHQEVRKLRQQWDENHFEALLGERQVMTPG
jgi:hypothetical protein